MGDAMVSFPCLFLALTKRRERRSQDPKVCLRPGESKVKGGGVGEMGEAWVDSERNNTPNKSARRLAVGPVSSSELESGPHDGIEQGGGCEGAAG